MIIAYRTPAIDGGWHGNRELRRGKITKFKEDQQLLAGRTKRGTAPAYYPSERDWMVPNLRDPYGKAEAL